MNKTPPQLIFFSGQFHRDSGTELKEAESFEKTSKQAVQLAYTDKNFAVGNLALSHPLNDTLVLRKG